MFIVNHLNISLADKTLCSLQEQCSLIVFTVSSGLQTTTATVQGVNIRKEKNTVAFSRFFVLVSGRQRWCLQQKNKIKTRAVCIAGTI